MSVEHGTVHISKAYTEYLYPEAFQPQPGLAVAWSWTRLFDVSLSYSYFWESSIEWRQIRGVWQQAPFRANVNKCIAICHFFLWIEPHCLQTDVSYAVSPGSRFLEIQKPSLCQWSSKKPNLTVERGCVWAWEPTCFRGFYLLINFLHLGRWVLSGAKAHLSGTGWGYFIAEAEL